jgi:hypothetical protein
MRTSARELPRRPGSPTPALVDAAVACVLLIAIELQGCLGGGNAGLAAAGGGPPLALAVALRRRTPLVALAIAIVVLEVEDLLARPLAGAASATLGAVVLISYATGAHLSRLRACGALGVALAGRV